MFNPFSKLWNDKRGNILVIAAAAIPIIVAAAGLATDTIQWTIWKRQLQRAADSAAIAGVYDRESNGTSSTTNVPTAVARDLALNNHTWMALKTGYPTISYPANSGVITDQVSVGLAVQQSLPFSSIFVSTAPTITASATASGVAIGDPCMLALDTTAAPAIDFSGNATVYMPNCPVFSNSSATNSPVAKGSSNVTTKSIGAVGGIQSSNNFHVGAYYPYSTAIADPFAGIIPSPSAMNCTTAALDENTSAATLTSYNCFSSLSVQPNKTLIIPPSYTGAIYINGGSLDFKGSFTCAACSIVLTNSSTSPTATIGTITTNASANVNIIAPVDGPFAGIAIYQDRRATDCSNCNKINGNSSSLITGALYFPNQELQYNGTGNTTAVCTMFVAKRLTFTGNSGNNQFKGLDQCNIPGSQQGALKIVRLVQ